MFVQQLALTYFLLVIIFHATRAATHWIVTEDGKIHTQDGSVFQMRRPYDLMSLLQQEKRAVVFSEIKNQLLQQKEEIEADSLSESDDDVEQLVYLTNADCLRAGKPLIEFDLYVGTLVFAYPKPCKQQQPQSNNNHNHSSGSEKQQQHRTFPEGFPIHFLHTASSTIIDDDDKYHSSSSTQSSSSSSSPSVVAASADALYYDGRKHDLYTITSANTSHRYVFLNDDGEDGDHNGNGDSGGGKQDDTKTTTSTIRKYNKDKDKQKQKQSQSTTTIEKIESIQDRAKYGPDCRKYLELNFSMTTFEHLPSIRERKLLNIDAEEEIHRSIGRWPSYEKFGTALKQGLKQNSTSWLLYTLASFYWRGVGSAEQSIECIRRALHTTPYEYRSIPLLSLATILHRARAFEEAAIVLHSAIDITADIPHAHYTLGNIYATLADYNKSIICYENVLKLAPTFEEAKQRKAAVLCHSNIENALKAQHDTLQKTLEELKDYQRQQELWINYHKKIRAEQAPANVLLEQRLYYNEFKIRQKIEYALDAELGTGVSTGSSNSAAASASGANNHTFIVGGEKIGGKTVGEFFAELEQELNGSTNGGGGSNGGGGENSGGGGGGGGNTVGEGKKLHFKFNPDSLMDKISIELVQQFSDGGGKESSSSSSTTTKSTTGKSSSSSSSSSSKGTTTKTTKSSTNNKNGHQNSNKNNNRKHHQDTTATTTIDAASATSSHHHHLKHGNECESGGGGGGGGGGSGKSGSSSNKKKNKQTVVTVDTTNVNDNGDGGGNDDGECMVRRGGGAGDGGENDENERPFLIPVTFVLPPS